MRWIWASVLVAGCSFQPGRFGPDAGDGVVDDAADAMLGEPQQWVFDTAAELGADGTRVDQLTIDEPGSLTQIGYTYGGLLMYGKQSQQLWGIATPTIAYDATIGVTPDGISLWGTELIDETSDLDRAGVVTNDVFTIWFEGEVFLDADDVLSVDADGAGFIDLELPTGWAHIESRTDGLAALPPVTTGGWYRVRAGWGEGTSNGFFDFRRLPMGSTAVHLSRDRLRAPTSKLQGAMREVYFRQIFGGAATNNGAPILSLETTPLMTQTSFTPSPLGSGSDTDWSARWYAQFYAAMPGTYAIRATTDDGNQVMLAGMQASASWGRGAGNANAVSTATADLAIGWHDIVLDYNQVGGGRAAALVVTAAPDAALVNAPIPLDRLRPVEPRRDRLVSQTRMFGPVTVPNNNNAGGPSRSIGFVGLPNETVTAIDLSILVDTDHLDQLVFRITPPGGTPIVVANHPAGGSFVNYFQLHTTAVGIVGQPLDGDWTLQVSDDTGGANNTSISEIALTMHTGAGPGQVATDGSWVSPVRDAGKAPVYVTDVDWVERAAIASELYLRSCTMADCSDDPPWGTPLLQNGTVVLSTQYIQAKLVLLTDGTTESVVDSLTITYRN
jgi:subtilisin-like proprotein convertase family protein